MITRKKLFWTEHCKIKMRQYNLSKSKLLKLLYQPERKEQGIVATCVAIMQTNVSLSKNKQKRPAGEIWLMYQDIENQRRIISAWRYPGISRPGDLIPIPKEILSELQNEFV